MISELTEIPENALNGLTKLKDLRLSNGKISSTVKDSLKGKFGNTSN